MLIKTFEPAYLQSAKAALQSAFARPEYHPAFNEWEFAETVLTDKGFIPDLCLIAADDSDRVAGYNILTRASVGDTSGLALGPLGIAKDYQNQGIGQTLVRESIKRAAASGYPWIVLLGGSYYSRFGFEKGSAYGIYLYDNSPENDDIQILFLEPAAKENVHGQLTYCDSFYSNTGELL